MHFNRNSSRNSFSKTSCHCLKVAALSSVELNPCLSLQFSSQSHLSACFFVSIHAWFHAALNCQTLTSGHDIRIMALYLKITKDSDNCPPCLKHNILYIKSIVYSKQTLVSIDLSDTCRDFRLA